MRDTYGRNGRVSWRGSGQPAWKGVACPACKAKPGWSCYQLSSWVTGHESPTGEGFYAKVRTQPHPERKRAAVPPVAGPTSDRGVLRDRIRELAQTKLAGSDRTGCRTWATGTKRTEAELAAKVAELEAMADLPW